MGRSIDCVIYTVYQFLYFLIMENRTYNPLDTTCIYNKQDYVHYSVVGFELFYRVIKYAIL